VRQRHFIDTHKGATGLVVLALIVWAGAWEQTTAWIYLATHGTYGLLWLLKSRVFPDRQWEQPCSLAFGAVIWGSLSLYWLTPWLIVTQHVSAPPWFLALDVAVFAVGVMLHFGADLQKHAHLARGPGLLTDGLWARTRNPNYLGELLIYGSFAALGWTWAWVGGLALATFFVAVWWPNMRRKDRSLARHPGFADWRARTGLLFPR